MPHQTGTIIRCGDLFISLQSDTLAVHDLKLGIRGPQFIKASMNAGRGRSGKQMDLFACRVGLIKESIDDAGMGVPPDGVADPNLINTA
jgi:hypothetical protein